MLENLANYIVEDSCSASPTQTLWQSKTGFSVLSESVSRALCYKLKACLCATVTATLLLQGFQNSYSFAALHWEKPRCAVGNVILLWTPILIKLQVRENENAMYVKIEPRL